MYSCWLKKQGKQTLFGFLLTQVISILLWLFGLKPVSLVTPNGPTRRHIFRHRQPQRHGDAAVSARRREAVVAGGRSTQFEHRERGSRVHRRRSRYKAQNNRGNRRWMLWRCKQSKTSPKRRRFSAIVRGNA